MRDGARSPAMDAYGVLSPGDVNWSGSSCWCVCTSNTLLRPLQHACTRRGTRAFDRKTIALEGAEAQQNSQNHEALEKETCQDGALPPSAASLDDRYLMFGRGQPDAAARPHRSVEDGSPLGTDRDENDVSIGWARSFSFAGTVVIVGFLLVFLRSILVPLVVALFLAYLVRPLAESISTCRCIPYFRKRQEAKRREEERGDEEKEPLLSGEVPPSERLVNDSRQLIGRVETLLPRWVGVILALILALGVIVGILAAMVVTITSFQAQMPKYRANALLLWQQLLVWLKVVFNVELSELQVLPSRVFSIAAGAFLTTSVTLSADLALVVVFLAFILLQPPASKSSLRKKVDDSISRYIILKSLISFSVSIFIYVVLAAVAFPLALFVALATFVLNFVPSLGPTISTLLVVPIIFLDNLAPYRCVIALLVPFLVHIAVGNILEPWLFGQEFSMNPVIILFSLGVWYIVWGTVGARPRHPSPLRPRPSPLRTRPSPRRASIAPRARCRCRSAPVCWVCRAAITSRAVTSPAVTSRAPLARQARCWPCRSPASCASCPTT